MVEGSSKKKEKKTTFLKEVSCEGSSRCSRVVEKEMRIQGGSRRKKGNAGTSTRAFYSRKNKNKKHTPRKGGDLVRPADFWGQVDFLEKGHERSQRRCWEIVEEKEPNVQGKR